MPVDSDIVESNDTEIEDPAKGRKAAAGIGICVVWYSVKCPGCNSKNTNVTSSRAAPYRYNKCRDCGLNFPSIEANFDENSPPLTSTIAQGQTKNKKNEENIPSKTGDFWSKRARL
jgi:hypothetical protein